MEYFQMDGVIIIGTFVVLINPLLFCQTMKPRYHKWAYSAPGHCYHDHVWWMIWSEMHYLLKGLRFLTFAVPPKIVKL